MASPATSSAASAASAAVTRFKRRQTQPVFKQVIAAASLREKSAKPRMKQKLTSVAYYGQYYHGYARWVTRTVRRCFTRIKLASLPSEQEVTGLSRQLVQDYLSHKLKSQGMMSVSKTIPSSRRTTPGLLKHSAAKELSHDIQAFGELLEKMYPKLYCDIGKQLNLSLKSESVLRQTMLALADDLFASGVTWGRIIAMFSLAAAFATDCVENERNELVGVVVDVFTSIVSLHLAKWISQQGGWGEMRRVFRRQNEASGVWVASIIGVVMGFTMTLTSALSLIDLT